MRCNFYIQQIANSALNTKVQKIKRGKQNYTKAKLVQNAKQFVVNKKRNAEMARKYATQTGRPTFHAPTTNTRIIHPYIYANACACVCVCVCGRSHRSNRHRWGQYIDIGHTGDFDFHDQGKARRQEEDSKVLEKAVESCRFSFGRQKAECS